MSQNLFLTLAHTNMQQKIKDIIQASVNVKLQLLSDESLLKTIEEVTDIVTTAFLNGNKVLFCGNGGSAADAQHLAAEFSGRFYTDRDPLPSEALHCNTSYLTAVANDYSFDVVYSRMVKAMAKPGDVLFAISTSGNSANIINAVEQGKKSGMICVGITGATGGKMNGLCDYLLNMPSKDTPRIQESHILTGHIICELVERKIFETTNK